jgi:hypothetical protein
MLPASQQEIIIEHSIASSVSALAKPEKTAHLTMQTAHGGSDQRVSLPLTDFVVSRQETELLSRLPPFSNGLSNDIEAEMMSNVKGKIKANKTNDNHTSNEPTPDIGNSASPLRGHRIDEIRTIISKRLLDISGVNTKLKDNGLNIEESRTAPIENFQETGVPILHQCTFHVQWSIKEFWNEQCRVEDLKSLESVIVLTGNVVDAQATTVGEYLRTNWPESSPLLLIVLQKFLKDGLRDSECMFTS